MIAICYPTDFLISKNYENETDEFYFKMHSEYEIIRYENELDLKSKIIYHNFDTLVIFTKNNIIRCQNVYMNFDDHAVISEDKLTPEYLSSLEYECGFINDDILKHMIEIDDHSRCSI